MSEPQKMNIFLLRHGKPDFPDARSYIYGHTDYPLCDLGVEQAEKVGRALGDVPMQRIVSSDLARAARTADIVAGLQREKLCEVERDAGLREIHMGEWDGVAKEDVVSGYVDIFRARGEDLVNIAAPGGETFLQLQARGIETLNRIVESSRGLERVLLVAHGGLFWSIVAGIFDLNLGDMMRFGLDYCALHLLEYVAPTERPYGNYRLIRYNWSPDFATYMNEPI